MRVGTRAIILADPAPLRDSRLRVLARDLTICLSRDSSLSLSHRLHHQNSSTSDLSSLILKSTRFYFVSNANKYLITC